MRAGVRTVAPAFLCLALVLAASPLRAEPPPDEFSGPGKAKEVSRAERDARRVLGELRRNPEAPATEAAVQLALYAYAESGDAADLELATTLARRRAEAAEGATTRPLFLVAQAGGPTLEEAEAELSATQNRLAKNPRIPTLVYAGFTLDVLARAAVMRDDRTVADALLATAAFLEGRTMIGASRMVVTNASGDADAATFADYLKSLEIVLVGAALSGAPEPRRHVELLGQEMMRRYWDGALNRFRILENEEDLQPWVVSLFNANAALLLWEAGYVTGDPVFKARAGSALEAVYEAALAIPEAAPEAALAALRLSGHPVQMVLVGSPASRELMELRNACYFLFEPRRILLNLDPEADTARMEEFGYPADVAPVLYLCVDTLCSAPIRSPEGLEGKVKEILALAAGQGAGPDE